MKKLLFLVALGLFSVNLFGLGCMTDADCGANSFCDSMNVCQPGTAPLLR